MAISGSAGHERVPKRQVSDANLVKGPPPATVCLVVPISDVNRTKPLIRLIVDQIGRRSIEGPTPRAKRQRLLLMLDEFPTFASVAG